MKKVLPVFILAALLTACGSDNSSTVLIILDGNGCLVRAGNFDWTEETVEDGFRTVNFRWECGKYISPLTGDAVADKRVTLTFTGTTCLQLTSELVNAGFCTQGKIN